jgi:formate dehydrogenase subunit delta
MANQIADQFPLHGPDAAAEAVAHHLRMFWEPHMRTHLLALVDAGAEGLDPVVVDAASRLRATVGRRARRSAGRAGR